MTIAIRQAKIGHAPTGTSVSTTLTSATLAGSTIVAFLTQSSTFVNQAAATGPAGFSSLGTQVFVASADMVDGYYKDNESAGVTTYSASGTNNVDKCLHIYELTASLTTGSKDKEAGATGTSVAPTASTGALSQASEVVLSATCAQITTLITADPSSTTSVEFHGTNGAHASCGQVVASTGSVTHTYSMASAKWALMIASFKDVTSGSGSSITRIPSIHGVPSLPSLTTRGD